MRIHTHTTTVSSVLTGYGPTVMVTDIHGPVAIESSQGFRYMIHFTDDFSRYTKVYFLKSRAGSAVTEKFKDYCNWLKKIHHQQHKDDFRVREVVPVRSIQVDGAQEYVAGEFAQHCEDMNIMQRVTSPYLHENAAIAERVWKTLQEVAMPMLTLSVTLIENSGLQLSDMPTGFAIGCLTLG